MRAIGWLLAAALFLSPVIASGMLMWQTLPSEKLGIFSDMKCGWIEATEPNGQTVLLNIASMASIQINGTVDGIPQGSRLWNEERATVVNETPDELMKRCR